MINSEEIKYIDINNGLELKTYFEGISTLFFECFNKSLDSDLWEWAYQKNPFGDAYVSIAIHEGRIVGHYAVVPMVLSNDKSTINSYISMTTMVSINFRGMSLFKKLAERVNASIESTGNPSVIFGFPNKNSAPGFKKRLGWTINESISVVSVNPEGLDGVKSCLHAIPKDSYSLNLLDDDVRDWRINKPRQDWTVENGLGLKSLEEGIDVMYLESTNSLDGYIPTSNFNIILDTSSIVLSENIKPIFNYSFGYKTFNMDFDPKFFLQMCMSDVF